MTIPAMNPIMKKELRVGARTGRFVLALCVYSLILAIIVISIAASAKVSHYLGGDNRFNVVYYSTFAQSFAPLVFFQLGCVCLIMPILTAGAISAEREKQTLDIMLTTPITPFSIMTGKLGSSMVKVFLFIISGVPAMSVCFLYGGIQWYSLIVALVGIMLIAFLTGAIGIWCSALYKKTVTAILMTLLTEGLIFSLPPILMMGYYTSEYARMYEQDITPLIVSMGVLPLLLLFCPIFTFIDVMYRACNGYEFGKAVLVDGIGGTYRTATFMKVVYPIWIPLAAAVTIALGIFFLWLAAKRVDSSRVKNMRLSSAPKVNKRTKKAAQ